LLQYITQHRKNEYEVERKKLEQEKLKDKSIVIEEFVEKSVEEWHK